MNKAQQKVVNEITRKIDNDIVSTSSGFSDSDMIEALEEIASFCEGVVDAKREEMRE